MKAESILIIFTSSTVLRNAVLNKISYFFFRSSQNMLECTNMNCKTMKTAIQYTEFWRYLKQGPPLLFFLADQLMRLVFPRNTAPETTLRRSRSLKCMPLSMLEFYIHNFQFHITGKIKWCFHPSVTPSLEMSHKKFKKKKIKKKKPYSQTLGTYNFAYRSPSHLS